jgi:hypothetical protein
MTRDVGKVATQAATGAPPEWDVMVATDAHHASLWLRKLQKPFDYKSLGVDEKLIDHDGGAISFVHQYIAAADEGHAPPMRVRSLILLSSRVCAGPVFCKCFHQR